MSRRPASLRALAAARGDGPADVLLRGGRVLAPASREWIETDLALCDGMVVGWGRRDALTTIDVDGAAISPGFIDAHIHLESTKLWVDEFARTMLRRGTTSVVADPHEIANVFGVPGVLALMDAARGLPFGLFVTASSCVPASAFESSGAEVTAADVALLLDAGALGVAEVMDYPSVIAGSDQVRAKIAAAGRRRVDGHAPGLCGQPLDAYLAAGIESDHECDRLAEAVEKHRKGMWVFLRQGSAGQNLADLAPMAVSGVTDHLAFCTDDREPDDLESHGHLDDVVRRAIRLGIPEIDALVLATARPAAYHRLDHLGDLGPGHQADLVVFESLESLRPALVFHEGLLVVEHGEVVPHVVPARPAPAWMRRSMSLGPAGAQVDPEWLIAHDSDGSTVRAIEVRPGSLMTGSAEIALSPDVDVAHIAVVERHHASGRVGTGWVCGFGIRRGAIASTVAHDAHNLVVIGARTMGAAADMAVAIARLEELGGGQVAVLDGQVIAELPLPIGGLMSDERADRVAAASRALRHHARAELGVSLSAPFMQMSFLALSVIPELRITDRGLLDVTRCELVDA